jgi:hypothetical protein
VWQTFFWHGLQWTTERFEDAVNENGTSEQRDESFSETVGRALRRAAKAARKTAKMYGTPIYVWENGKVVAKKP